MRKCVKSNSPKYRKNLSNSKIEKRISKKDFKKGFPKRISKKDFQKGFPKRISKKDFKKGFPKIFVFLHHSRESPK